MGRDKMDIKESLGALIIKKTPDGKHRATQETLCEKEDPGNRQVTEELEAEKQ